MSVHIFLRQKIASATVRLFCGGGGVHAIIISGTPNHLIIV